MKGATLLSSLVLLLSLSGCTPYPEDAKNVALAVCEAAKTLDTDTISNYTTKSYARKLKAQGDGYRGALKNKNPKALALQKQYAQISCDDLTVVEIEGRMMEIKSSSALLNGLKLKEIKRQWKIIE